MKNIYIKQHSEIFVQGAECSACVIAVTEPASGAIKAIKYYTC